MATAVTDNPDDHRYEIHVDGVRAGFAEYVHRGGRTIFVHTEVDPAFGGRGVGSALIAGALDAEREAGRKGVPLCSFVARYIDRHPEYADMVDTEMLERLDTPSTPGA